jgi:death on curing protein
MNEPIWIRPDVIIAYHERLLAEHGGSAGIREPGLLESASDRPRNLFAYSNPTLHDLAASYGYGIVKNQPFIDGNKRIGLGAAVLFLELNGIRFTATEEDAVLRALALAAGEMTESAFAAWLESNSHPA